MSIVRTDPDRLYRLLPALYRIEDEEHGHQLQALLALVTAQADLVRADIQQLWDDSFIETSQRWVIPYIGDLVGATPLLDSDLTDAAATAEALFPDLAGPDLRPPAAIRTRADVASTISYRRRKGTPAMLEELARAVTGWDARVVEFFTLLGWTQHLEHLRPACHGAPDLRRVDAGERAGGPWDTTTHTVDVRAIAGREGWYNVPNVGFFLWRLRAFPHTRVTPRAIGDASWRRTFSPLGHDQPLYASGLVPRGDSGLATEPAIAAPIRAAALFEDLSDARTSAAPASTWYGGTDTAGSFVVYVNGDAAPARQVQCANLGGWDTIPQPVGSKILVDPGRGRLVVPAGFDGEEITVSYHRGFSAEMGGGEYDHRKWLAPGAPVTVSGGGNALKDALVDRAGTTVVIEVTDSATYDLPADLALRAGESLTIQASAAGAWPHLKAVAGELAVRTKGEGASLTLCGLLVEGGVVVTDDLDRLRLIHTTLVPGRSVVQGDAAVPQGPSLEVRPAGDGGVPINTRLEVQVAFSITGALRMPSHVAGLWLLDSIVAGVLKPGETPGVAIADAAGRSGPPAHIERSTVLGSARFLKLPMASESIFTGDVQVEQRQQGCVRFCFVSRPPASRTPPRYRCQPELEIARELERRRAGGATLLPAEADALADAIAGWLVPAFASDQYGDPEFGQLALSCPVQVRAGAEDGSEMGAFCVLKQPQREANLRLRLDEYLPIGLEAGIIYVTREHQSG